MNKINQDVLGNPKTIRILIMKRAEVTHIEYQPRGTFYHTGTIDKSEKQEPISIYSELDELIEECRFSKESIEIINYIQQGYTFRQISEKVGIDNSNISKRLTTICKNIAKQYKLNLLKQEAREENIYFKKCTKCGERLPELSEFFSFDRSKRCHKSSCKKCRKG